MVVPPVPVVPAPPLPVPAVASLPGHAAAVILALQGGPGSVPGAAALLSLLADLAGTAPVVGHFHVGVFRALEDAVRAATGPFGLVVIFVYSFLIAFVLPLPSEIVLATPLQLGLGYWPEIAIIILVSGAGKAAGSLLAFGLGQEAKESGPIIRLLRRSRFNVVSLAERRTVKLAQDYGYAGLALALCVPGFPDTLSIYAFSVLEEDYLKFAAATFFGSAGRLVFFLAVVEGTLAIV
jgi:membrane protein YqaA with SNARE-associated domain